MSALRSLWAAVTGRRPNTGCHVIEFANGDGVPPERIAEVLAQFGYALRFDPLKFDAIGFYLSNDTLLSIRVRRDPFSCFPCTGPVALLSRADLLSAPPPAPFYRKHAKGGVR